MLDSKMFDDTIEEMDENTRALMLMQAAIRNIKAAEKLIPIDNRLTQARDLLERSHKELREYVERHRSNYGE